MISFQEVVRRAHTGPITSEREFELELFIPTSRRLAERFGIVFDPETPVPDDDHLADRVWQAGVEFFSEIGVFCPDTERRILFSREEIERLLHDPPSEVWFGGGTDRRPFPRRIPESETRPWCSVGAAGCPVSSETILKNLVRHYALNPYCDSVTTPSLALLDGFPIVAGSPLEVEGAIRSVMISREGLRQAGRPDLAIVNAVATATHAVGHIAGAAHGIRTTDALEIGAHHEMRVDYDSLNKVSYAISKGHQIWAENGVVLGGIAGGPATTAIVTAAYNLLDMLVLRGSLQHPFPIHVNLRTTTSRDTLWVRSISNQAISRNSWLPIANLGYVGAGPATQMAFLETAAWVIASVASGGSIEAEGIAKNAHTDHTGPLEPYFACEVAHAVSGWGRSRANEIVKSLLEKYEAGLDDPPQGTRIQECMDIGTGEIEDGYRRTYLEARDKIAKMCGLQFKWASIYD